MIRRFAIRIPNIHQIPVFPGNMSIDFQAIIDSETPVLIDFWAQWCGPCKAMMPALDTLGAELGEGLRIVKLDVDEHLDLAVDMKVLGVPTLMLYRKGQLLWRDAGVQTKNSLRAIIETHAGLPSTLTTTHSSL